MEGGKEGGKSVGEGALHMQHEQQKQQKQSQSHGHWHSWATFGKPWEPNLIRRMANGRQAR